MAWRRLPRLPSRSFARSGAGEAIRTSGDWTVLAKYCLVGASGYAVNLAVYLTLVRGAGLHYLMAAACSFLVAVTNNYTWNRLWTFRAQRGRVGRQGARFLVVSTAALTANLLCLRGLVELGLDKVRVQALAILLVTPISFLGNKLWSFGAPAERPLDGRRLGLVIAVTACLLGAIYLCFAFGAAALNLSRARHTAQSEGRSSARYTTAQRSHRPCMAVSFGKSGTQNDASRHGTLPRRRSTPANRRTSPLISSVHCAR